MADEFITLARVLKTQGRRGEVAAEPHSDAPERFQPGMRLWALPKDGDGPRRELRIEEVWPHKGHLVLKFEGVDSISDAESLIGCELQVPASERSKLEAGWVYVSDLVGCEVFDGDREIGRVQDVQFGAGEAPLLIVKAGANEYEIPYAEAYLKGADLEQKKIYMILPEGMLELNAPMTAEEKEQQKISNKKLSS
ncbi:MAG: ribosome maturation factor RimM [Acidobacteriia bacterium]|nr:ribosome maturation factor RimM [Terriglobia bacterium]